MAKKWNMDVIYYGQLVDCNEWKKQITTIKTVNNVGFYNKSKITYIVTKKFPIYLDNYKLTITVLVTLNENFVGPLK